MDHLQACVHCSKYGGKYGQCLDYTDTAWVNRLGGCGAFPYRELPTGMSYVDGKIQGRGRVGQQKQAHNDRKYHSKNDAKAKFRGKM